MKIEVNFDIQGDDARELESKALFRMEDFSKNGSYVCEIQAVPANRSYKWNAKVTGIVTCIGRGKGG